MIFLKAILYNLCWSLGACSIQPTPIPIPKPVIRAEIAGDLLYNLLINKFPEAHIHISDRVKYLCDIDDINAFLKQDETNHIQYTPELMDCDDFTFRLKGQFSTPEWAKIATGIIWTEKHALMFFVDANQDFWWIEPQSDKVQSELESWQGQKVLLIVI